jgi:hypothetical protein
MARLTTTPYAASGSCGTHQDSDWQIARDEEFTDIIEESLNNNTDLEEITLPVTETDIPIYFRAKHRSATCESEWSNVVIKILYDSVFNPVVLTPSLNVSVNRTFDTLFKIYNVDSIELTGSPFALESGAANHVATDWVIEDEEGNIVWSSLVDAVNLETITISNPDWFSVEKYYRYKVRYITDFITGNGDPVASQWRVFEYSEPNSLVLGSVGTIPYTNVPGNNAHQPQQKLEDIVMISLEDSILNPNKILVIVPVFLQKDENDPYFEGDDEYSLDFYLLDNNDYSFTFITNITLSDFFFSMTAEVRQLGGSLVRLTDNASGDDRIVLLMDFKEDGASTRTIRAMDLRINSSQTITLENIDSEVLDYPEVSAYDPLKLAANDLGAGIIGLRVNEFYYVFEAVPLPLSSGELTGTFIPLNPLLANSNSAGDPVNAVNVRGAAIVNTRNNKFLSVGGFLDTDTDVTLDIYSTNTLSIADNTLTEWTTTHTLGKTAAWSSNGAILFDSGRVIVYYNLYSNPYFGDPYSDFSHTGYIDISEDETITNAENVFGSTTSINRKLLRTKEGILIAYGGYKYEFYTFDGGYEVLSPNNTVNIIY